MMDADMEVDSDVMGLAGPVLAPQAAETPDAMPAPEPAAMPAEMPDAMSSPEPASSPDPVPSSTPPGPAAKTADGKYIVCVAGEETVFGDSEAWRSAAITVKSDGTCTIGEWAGGFDGYWNVDAGTSHEKKFARSVKDMLRDEDAVVGKTAGKNNPLNKDVDAFMETLRERSQPENLDFPQDEKKADNGIRANNIAKASEECTKMISVQSC